MIFTEAHLVLNLGDKIQNRFRYLLKTYGQHEDLFE